MANKQKIGGRAYTNGVRLMNEELSAKAYYDQNNNLQLGIKRVSRSNFYNMFKRVPVIRGIISIIMAIVMFVKESSSNPRKYWFVFLIIIADIIYFILPAGGTAAGIMTGMYYFLPLLLLIIFWSTVQEVLKYHGAEHKTVNYYEHDCKGEINSYSRLHKRCGSNVVFYYLIISLLMGFVNININLFIMELLYLGLAYELMRYTPEFLEFIPFTFQRLVTREPEERHIRAAEMALGALTDGGRIYGRFNN